MAKAIVALAVLAAAASADRVLSTEFTYLGDLLPIHTKSEGFASFQINKGWYENGFNSWVMKDGKKVIEQSHQGVFTHAPAAVSYHVEGKYSAFDFCVGLDAYAGRNSAEGCGNHDGVMFRVVVDGQTVWEKAKRMGEVRTCHRVALEVIDPAKNAQTLELIVDKQQNNDCDEAEWTDAKLYEDPVVDCQQLGSLVPSYHSVGWGSYWVNRRWHEKGFQIAGAKYSNGVFAHAPSKLIYPLHNKFDTFSACVGLDDGVSSSGNGDEGYTSKDCGEVAFKVLVDGKQMPLLNQVADSTGPTEIRKKGMDPVTCIFVHTTGGKHLELVVDHLQDSRCDESEWVNANICREAPQPLDCKMNDWAGWDTCSKSCGTGYQTRKRSRKQAAQWGGKDCPQYSQTRGCSTQSCPIDCKESKWSDWVQCSATCGGGYSFRYRSEDRSDAFGGASCGDLSEKKICGTTACPIDCQVSEWGPWGQCSKKCGGGEQLQNRTIIVHVKNKGKECPGLKQKQSCNTHSCAIDCRMTTWSSWSKCSVECGGGTQSRKRTSDRAQQHGGKGCPLPREDRACNISPCPIDCELSDWGNWPSCSATCGTGRKTRYRSIEVTSAFGGTECGNLTHTQKCNDFKCPIDCLPGPWEEWTKCDLDCGGGQKQRFRVDKIAVAYGGKPCGSNSQSAACNTHACPINCKDKGFGKWSTCTKSCGTGGQVRHRNVIQAQYGGTKCASSVYQNMMQTQDCNIFPCANDCKITDWSPWSTCDKPCGSGNMFRTRADTAEPSSGGKACPALRQERACNVQSCPEDCSFSVFTPFNSCSESCGGGTQKRTRTITKKATHGGKCEDVHGGTTETRECNIKPCPTDCVLSDWGTAGKCSRTCTKPGEKAIEIRKRTILAFPTLGGKPCGDVAEDRPCTTTPPACKVDCEWTAWSSWDTCSEECGGGVMTATRSEKTDTWDGADCTGLAKKTKPCNSRPCPIKCVVTDWAAWSTCSRSCGTGYTVRKRKNDKGVFVGYDAYDTKGENGGTYVNKHVDEAERACPDPVQATTCNVHACPKDCEVTQWTSWTRCNKSCGTGIRTRERELTPGGLPDDGGKACPDNMKEVEWCNEQQCEQKNTKKWEWKPYTETVQAKYISAEHMALIKASENQKASSSADVTATTTKAAANFSHIQQKHHTFENEEKKACVWGVDENGNNIMKVHGWAGAGSGDQFCNLLTCNDGTMEGENARDCRAPFRMIGAECKSIKCSFVYDIVEKHELLKITHTTTADVSIPENQHHHCAYNQALQRCKCVCYISTAAVDAPDNSGAPARLQWSQE